MNGEGRTMKQDIEAVYALADQGMSLSPLMDAILQTLSCHEEELSEITNSYRLCAVDTGYEKAFALNKGRLSLHRQETVDVTISGKAEDLERVFRRKLSPVAALLRGKIKLSGDKSALLKLAAFL